jgi:predicted transcriptional regulator
MSRKKNKTCLLTPPELQIMQVLWRNGPSNVRQVQEALQPLSKLAYTTVQTTLSILQRKGKVERSLRDRAYEYMATLSREDALSQALCDIKERMCDGSWDILLASVDLARQFGPNACQSE